jgi:hypothetical protein
MGNHIDTCEDLLDAIEGGIDYRTLQATATGDGPPARLSSVVLDGELADD